MCPMVRQKKEKKGGHGAEQWAVHSGSMDCSGRCCQMCTPRTGRTRPVPIRANSHLTETTVVMQVEISITSRPIILLLKRYWIDAQRGMCTGERPGHPSSEEGSSGGSPSPCGTFSVFAPLCRTSMRRRLPQEEGRKECNVIYLIGKTFFGRPPDRSFWLRLAGLR